MKSWEIERMLKEEGREEGRKEESANTEKERKRADDAERRAEKAESDLQGAKERINELESLLKNG